MRGIVGEEKRGFVTVLGRHEEWEVDATEGDWGQGFTIRVLERKVNCNNHLQDLTSLVCLVQSVGMYAGPRKVR